MQDKLEKKWKGNKAKKKNKKGNYVRTWGNKKRLEHAFGIKLWKDGQGARD
jgi:hypothetical protein